MTTPTHAPGSKTPSPNATSTAPSTGASTPVQSGKSAATSTGGQSSTSPAITPASTVTSTAPPSGATTPHAHKDHPASGGKPPHVHKEGQAVPTLGGTTPHAHKEGHAVPHSGGTTSHGHGHKDHTVPPLGAASHVPKEGHAVPPSGGTIPRENKEGHTVPPSGGTTPHGHGHKDHTVPPLGAASRAPKESHPPKHIDVNIPYAPGTGPAVKQGTRAPPAAPLAAQPAAPPKEDKQSKKKRVPCPPHLCTLVPANVPAPDFTQAILHPRKDVFVLKVAKVGPNGDRRCRMELELVTPKSHEKTPPYRMDTRETQFDPECTCCSCSKEKKKK